VQSLVDKFVLSGDGAQDDLPELPNVSHLSEFLRVSDIQHRAYIANYFNVFFKNLAINLLLFVHAGDP